MPALVLSKESKQIQCPSVQTFLSHKAIPKKAQSNYLPTDREICTLADNNRSNLRPKECLGEKFNLFQLITFKTAGSLFNLRQLWSLPLVALVVPSRCYLRLPNSQVSGKEWNEGHRQPHKMISSCTTLTTRKVSPSE